MAAGLNSLEDFLLNQQAQLSLSNLVMALIIAIFLSVILGKLYTKYGTSLSNRKKFSGNFVLLATTTTLIITIVKSSLALSLGLVGALSIVRFRAAIKEPEELAFLFLVISIGLGLGANQFGPTIVSFAIISLVIYGRHFFYSKEENQNLYLTISDKSSKNFNLNNLILILKKHCKAVHLKRFDKSEDGILESSFLVDFSSYHKLEKLKEELEKLSKSINITYIDQSGLY